MTDIISFSILLLFFVLLAFVAVRFQSKSQELENLKIRQARLEADLANEQRSVSEKTAMMQES